MKEANRNIFNLKRPDEFTCHLMEYFFRHSRLIIGTHPPLEEGQVFYFSNPIYFEGTFSWQGADFCIAGKLELRELLQRLNFDNLDTLVDTYTLFIVESSHNHQIKIVAAKAMEIKRPAIDDK